MNNQKPKSRMQYGLKRTAATCCGNTLVPLVIAISISAIATVAFLDEGSKLTEKQKAIQAPDEVLKYIQEWVNLRKQKGSTAIIPSELSFHNNTNIFGWNMVYEDNISGEAAAAKRFRYPVETRSQCERLKAIFSEFNIIQEARCSGRALYLYLRFD